MRGSAVSTGGDRSRQFHALASQMLVHAARVVCAANFARGVGFEFVNKPMRAANLHASRGDPYCIQVRQAQWIFR